MNRTQAIRIRETGKTLLLGLLLIGLAVALGLFLGNEMVSDYQNALRMTVVGGLLTAILMSPINGMLLWLIIAPFGEATYTEIWRILNIRLPSGIPDLTPARLVLALLSVVLVAHLAVGKRRLRRLGPEVFMAIFCLMAVPAVTAGMDGLSSTGQTFLDKFILPFLVFVLAKNLYEEKSGIDKLCGTLAIIGLYIAFMVFYEHFTGQPLFVAPGRTTEYSRSLRKIISLLGNPAFLGTVLGMIVPMALYKFVRERSTYSKAFYGAVFVVTGLGNFFCYNRGAWLALAAALIVMLMEREYRRLLLPVLLVGALIALVYWQVISESAVVTERLSNVTSVRFRLDLLEVSKIMIREHLLFGVGVGNFAYYFVEYGGHWETLAYDLPTPHNSYVLILSTMGLLSFIPYVLIFLSSVVQMLAAIRRSRLDKRIDRALLVSGLATVVVYAVSAAAVDLHINVFSSFVLFFTAGTILGYVSSVRRGIVASAKPEPGPVAVARG